jgi:transcriptional regulator with XRE-family HTH domain
MTKLKERRQASGLSQGGLAKASGVDVRIIQTYEQSYRDINKAAAFTVYKLAKALGCHIEDILEI